MSEHLFSGGTNTAPLGNEITVEEMEKMVIIFRLQELKSLLSYASYPISGKKQELTDRALALVRNTRSPLIKDRVRQLYRQIYDRDKALMESNFDSRVMPMPGINAFPRNPYGAYACAVSGTFSAPMHPISPPINNGPSPQPVPPPMNMVNNRPSTTSLLHSAAARQNINVNPPVKLTHLPFYDVQSDILKPVALVPMTAGKYQDNHVSFNLSRDHLRVISVNDRMPLPRTELQLRFCLLNLNGEQKDDFPSGCVLRMNDKMVQIPNPIPSNKVGVEAKRPGRPVDLTNYVSRSGNGDQRVHVSWTNDGVRVWTVSVYIVRHLTTAILLQRIKSKGIRAESEVIRMIKEKLGGNDGDIAATSLRVSLLCPLGKIRMHLPCRLRSCKHLQCFDLDLFLQMNEKKPTWTCPVCDAPTMPFGDLQIDGYFTRLLMETKDEPEVELYDGGGFAPISSEEVNVVDDDKPSTSASSPKKSVITKVPKPLSAPMPKVSASSTNDTTISLSSSATDDVVVIDLSSDDDDDDRPVVRPPASQYAASSSTRAQEIDDITSSSSPSSPTPSLIILDSPSPQSSTNSATLYVPISPPPTASRLSTPDDPQTVRDQSKRSFDPDDGGADSSKKPKFSGYFDDSKSKTTTTSNHASLLNRIFRNAQEARRADNEFPNYAHFFQQFVDGERRRISANEQALSHSSQPTSPTFPNTLPTWKPLTPTGSGSTSTQSANSSASNTSTLPNNLSEEFKDFLQGILPP